MRLDKQAGKSFAAFSLISAHLLNLKSFPDNCIKSLFGLDVDVLAQVIIKVLPALEQQREHRLRTSPEPKRRFITPDGRPPQMKPIHKLLMTLLYPRHNTSATVVGQMFGFSAESFEKNALPEVLAVLKELFPAARSRSRSPPPKREIES